MKKNLCLFGAALVLMLGACERTTDLLPQDEAQSFVKTTLGDVIPGQYVVLLKEGTTAVKSSRLNYPEAQIMMKSETQKILNASGIMTREPLQVYSASTEGFAVKLSDDEAASLRRNNAVLGVWPDRMFILAKPAPVPTPLPAEVTPPGITRVGEIGRASCWERV